MSLSGCFRGKVAQALRQAETSRERAVRKAAKMRQNMALLVAAAMLNEAL